ncbi:MAG: hypothetical protein RJB66_1771 [Pseudomonadota bacterium]
MKSLLRRFTLLFLLVSLPLTGGCQQATKQAQEQRVRMKIMLLSITDDPRVEPEVEVARQALLALSIDFDHIVLTDGQGNKTRGLPALENSSGDGQYYGVIATNGDLAFRHQSGSWISALNPEEWKTLEDYEAQRHLRRVSLNTWPSAKLGLAIAGSPGNKPVQVVLNKDFDSSFSGLTSGAKAPLENNWQMPAKITNPEQAKAVLFYERDCSEHSTPSEGCSNEQTIASAVVKFNDGREQMHFFFAQSPYSKGSMMSTHLWVPWLTKGFFTGHRKVFLNVHIDDYFLSTPIWNPTTQSTPSDGSRDFRLTKQDIQTYLDWQHKELIPRLGDGSFKLEMAFNGYGVWERRGYARDPLFKYSQKIKDEFFWVNHTYSHLDLNMLNYPRAMAEFYKNRELSKDLFGTLDFSNYSDHAMITPRISGLFSAEVLKAMKDSHINAVIGDTTRPEITPKNVYVGRWTTKEQNGADGILIIPRAATEIYFNVSTLKELESEYNHYYLKHFKKHSTYLDIFHREAYRVTKSLLRFEPTPHMFHQPNIRAFYINDPATGELNVRHSLISLWLDFVTRDFRTMSSLPLRALKLDDLHRYFLRRMSFNDCEFEAYLTLQKGEAKGLTTSSKKNCEVYFTIPKQNRLMTSKESSTTNPDNLKSEANGPDTIYSFSSSDQNLSFTIEKGQPRAQ